MGGPIAWGPLAWGPSVRTQPSTGDPKGPKALYSPSTVGSPYSAEYCGPRKTNKPKKTKRHERKHFKEKEHFFKEKGGT